MDSRGGIVEEYRIVLSKLAALKGEKHLAVLRMFELGWLTPGSEILKRLRSKELSLEKVLEQPDSMQRKWFADLNNLEKSRWVKDFRIFCGYEKLEKIFQLTRRRLQQLEKNAKRVSDSVTRVPRGPVARDQESPELPNLSGDGDEASDTETLFNGGIIGCLGAERVLAEKSRPGKRARACEESSADCRSGHSGSYARGSGSRRGRARGL